MIHEVQKNLLILFVFLNLFLNGCALFVTRPVQEMSDTVAAIRAAREVQADSRAPELYRQANEWFFKARQEYRLKNFKEARQHATRARRFAEEAELEALITGANRSSVIPPDPYLEGSPPPPPTQSEVNMGPDQGMFVESYEEQQRKKDLLDLERSRAPQINIAPTRPPEKNTPGLK